MHRSPRAFQARPLSPLFVFLACSGLAFGADWTHWLGTDGTRSALSPNPNQEFPESLVLMWDHAVGEGYGSPIVVGDAVFQHARQGENEVVWKIDGRTGVPLWRKTFAVPFRIGGGGQYHGKGPKSSPAYADGRLFVMSIDGSLSCFDAGTGDLAWRRDYEDEFAPSHPYWGATTSPLVQGSVVLARFGAEEDGALIAHRVSDGAVQWRDDSFGTSYSSPQRVEFGATSQTLEWNHDTLAGWDTSDGSVLWSRSYPQIGTNQNSPTPVLLGNRVFVGGENRGMRAFDVILDSGEWRVEEAWFQRRASLDMSTAIVSGGRVFGLTHLSGGRLFCLNPETGAMIWEGPSRAAEHATFLAGDGFVAALLNEGEMKILSNRADEYRELASYRVSESATWAPPVILEDGFLIKDRRSLRRLRFVVDEDTDTTPTL